MRDFDRRRMLLLSGAWLAGTPIRLRARAPGDGAALIAAGRRFLAGLYDSELQLLPEFRGHNVYWLFHDNYLAAKVLGETHPELARKIREGIARHGVAESGKIEILFGESRDPLPFRRYELAEVARVGEKIVRTERVVGEQFEGWREYGDLLFLASIAQAESDPERAGDAFEAGLAMWDGVGIRDRVVEVNERYATYKLALALIAGARLGVMPLRVGEAMTGRLGDLQNEAGGWITDYLPDGKPIGKANVETTCMAILALKNS